MQINSLVQFKDPRNNSGLFKIQRIETLCGHDDFCWLRQVGKKGENQALVGAPKSRLKLHSEEKTVSSSI